MDFDPTQPYPSTVMAWIRLPRLPGHMYKRQVLREIGKTIGKVSKLDFNIDNGMLVERKIRKSGRAGRKDTGETAIEAEGKSRFQVLKNLDGDEFE
ncbi:hypothetical protein GOBAR_AA16774 [Gossypium barbadense]|uniref:Uncharacterized protein n=1 Tax=Gossypium barbadense TaxID=3634 RepID=A0A2P5XKM1_GOSBA|nr:hypothetical protein GOBAR_AA16774 [Gossypium barbadense]